MNLGPDYLGHETTKRFRYDTLHFNFTDCKNRRRLGKGQPEKELYHCL